MATNQVRSDRLVQGWLVSIAALIALMVMVGGATRLTESGLSIVEWKPVAGILPPLNQEQWTTAFEGYKTVPQYRQMNSAMSLDEFKTIFWWEWSHRLLGRVIAIAYFIPFLFFLWRGVLAAELRLRLWVIFGLGALQGAVGWWMVASGLSQRVEVSQYRLATHLVLALVIFTSIVWTLRRISAPRRSDSPPRLKFTAIGLLVLTFVQLYLGALVAGLRAGRIYDTWPDIDGTLVPSAARLFFDTPWWRNLFENTLTVQFEHRMVAYALLVAAAWHALDAIRSNAAKPIVEGALWLAAAVILQATLGILTLLNQAPMGLALAHQGVAIAVLTLATLQAERLTGRAGREPQQSVQTAAQIG
jgi:heme a synthase